MKEKGYDGGPAHLLNIPVAEVLSSVVQVQAKVSLVPLFSMEENTFLLENLLPVDAAQDDPSL